MIKSVANERSSRGRRRHPGSRACAPAAICWLALAGATASCPPPASADPNPRIVLDALPRGVVSGRAVRVAGRLTGPAPAISAQPLELEASRGKSSRFVATAHAISNRAGGFSFPPLRVEGDVRLRVLDTAEPGVVSQLVAIRAEAPDFPLSRSVRAAARYLSRRAGTKAFAVVDDKGQLAGVAVHRRFHSASVVKSMLLVAYLQGLARKHRPLEGGRLLYPMIHSSNNEAASQVLEIVGEAALNDVARQAHMADYVAAGAWWGFTQVSASDLARFFYVQERLIPARFRDYARWLLSTIEQPESWGIPAAARPRFEVFFKGGWLPEVEGLVNQAARLQRGRTVFALAVLTRRDPSMVYGERTIEGVTRALLARR